MKDKNDKGALQEAIEIVRGGLKDEFTRLRMCIQYANWWGHRLIYYPSGYRPSLCRRLARLENMLSVPVGERWKNEATLNGCDHIFVEGIRLDEVIPDTFKSSSRAATSQRIQTSTVSIPFISQPST